MANFSNPPTGTQPLKQQASGGSPKLVLIAVIIALCVTVLNYMYIQSERNNTRMKSVVVYRYKHNIKAGKMIDEDDLEATEMADKFKDSFSDAYVDQYGKKDSLELIKNKPLTQDVRENSIVTYSHFTEASFDRIDKKITPGYRLVALPVNYKTLPGILRPGMYVDIEAPFITPGNPLPKVMPVMEYVKVVAVGKKDLIDAAANSNRSTRIGNFSTISIEVTPEQATQLSSIQKITSGDFEIHLRYPADSDRPKIHSSGLNPDVMHLIGRTVNSR